MFSVSKTFNFHMTDLSRRCNESMERILDSCIQQADICQLGNFI